MKKQTLLGAVLAVALVPTIAMSADSNVSFERDAQLCDSWTWQDEGQTARNLNLVAKQSKTETAAFDDSQYSIGW